MPSLPSGADQHINTYLSAVSVAYVQESNKFVSRQAFPVVPVAKQSGKVATYDRGDFLRDEAKQRAAGAESAGGGYRTSSETFSCDVWAYHKDVADQDRALVDDPFSMDRDAAVYLAQKALIKEEVQWATDFFTTGIWTGSTTGTDLVAGTDFTAWDDVAGTPIENVSDEAAEIESNTGVLPNMLVVNRRGWMALKNHPDVVDRVKHTSAESITTDLVARLMGLDRVLVAAGVRNTAGEGLTATADYIIGNHALLVYSAPNPGLYTPSGGYTFVYDALGGDGLTVSTYRADLLKSDRHEIEWAFDHKVLAPVTGVFFQNICS